MLAKLLSLLLHAKAGAISGVFLIGATGALVSVSASNGVTTVTIEPSPTPTAAVIPARPVTSPPATPTPTPASPQLSSPVTSSACSDEAKALALQVQRVNTAFGTFRTDLKALKGLRDEKVLKTADQTLKSVRQAAVRAIHGTATATCLKKDDDEDKTDEDKTDATDADTNVQHGDDNDADEDKGDDHKDKTPGLTFTGDAVSIAGQAITAMQTAFDTAKNSPVTTSTKKNDENKSAKASPKKDDKKGDHGDHHD